MWRTPGGRTGGRASIGGPAGGCNEGEALRFRIFDHPPPMDHATPPAARGLFFSFEGIDGSGKSTQARLLGNALRDAGETVVAVREPGGTPLGEAVRGLLLDPETLITPRAEALLFAAARAQLVQTVIEPALLAGHHVIADRYVDSTSAYQGAGRRLGESVHPVIVFATSGRMPDRTYLITLSPEEALRRRSTRHSDRMELQPDDFLNRIAESYDQLALDYPERVLAVRGDQAPETISQIVEQDAYTLIWKRAAAQHH